MQVVWCQGSFPPIPNRVDKSLFSLSHKFLDKIEGCTLALIAISSFELISKLSFYLKDK